jgi:WG containing repeat
MKLKLVRSIILGSVAILSLASCSQTNGELKSSIPNLQITNPSASPNLDRFLFRQNGKLGYIDRTGKIVVPAKFDRIDEDFSEGLAAISIGKKWGYIDPMGKIVIPLKFDQTTSFHEGLAGVSIAKNGSDEWGYIDKTGKIIIPVQFQNHGSFKNGLAYIFNG